MTLRQIEYLLTVVEENSFTRAAQHLHVTQPGLSQQIGALERAVGAPLIERLKHGVRLTAEGRAFAVHAAAALREERRAREVVRDMAAGRVGELEIATVLSVAVGVLPPSLLRWHAQAPDVSVRLVEHRHRRDLEASVAAGVADLAIGPRPPRWSGPVVSLGVERFVLVLPADDAARRELRAYAGATPRAAPRSQGRLPLAAVGERDWVMMVHENGLSELVDTHLGAVGIRPPVALRTSQTEAAARFGAAGVGVSLLPANALPGDLAALVCEPDPPLTRELTAYARHPFSGVVERYIELLRTETRALEPVAP